MQERASYKGYLIFFILILIYAVFTIRYTPIFEQLGSDKEVFQYMGMLIKNHQFPYSHAFDHKPPVIYLLNYLGVMLTPNTTWGIFIILNSLGFFSALLIYKLAVNTFKTHILPLLLCVSFICINNNNFILEEGNLTRQLAAFLTVGILFIVFIGKKSNLKNTIIGFLIGVIFFAQQNEILGGLVLAAYYLLFQGSFKFYTLETILKNSVFFLLGALVPFVGIFLVINYWGNYDDFINQVFLFNFSNYIEDKSFIEKIGTVIYEFAKLVYKIKALLVISFLVVISLFLSLKNKKRWILNSKVTVVVLAFIFQILSTSISGKDYGHYFLMFIPYVFCLFIFSFNGKIFIYKKYVSIMLLLVLMFHVIKTMPYKKPDTSLLELITKEVASVRDQKGKFYSLNGRYLRVNFNLNSPAPSKHIYTHFMSDAVAKEIIEDLQINQTSYVLMDKGDAQIIPQSLQSFIALNFEEILTYQRHVLFEKRLN